MYKILFYSRWAAALWATATLISIATFVGEGGGHEEVDKLAKELAAERKAPGVPGDTNIVIDEDGVPPRSDKGADGGSGGEGEGDDADAADAADTYVIINKSAPVNQSSDEDVAAETGETAARGAL